MRKHDCPYLKANGKCDNKKMRIADCIYIDPAKCPILRDSKAWKGMCRFFIRKSKIKGSECEKPVSYTRAHR